MRARPDGWRSTQRRADDGAIDSEQAARALHPVVERSERGARLLGSRYWLEVARASRGFVRCHEGTDGVVLQTLGRGPILLCFGPAQTCYRDDLVSCEYMIRGGILARRSGGVLSLSQVGRERPELRAAVSGFFPRFAARPGSAWRGSGALYELERRIHVAISRRYLARLLLEEQP